MLWTIAFIALGIWAVRRAFFGYPDPSTSTELLSPREMRFLARAGDTLFPAGGEPSPSGSEAEVPAFVDRYVAAMPRHLRILMRLLFFLVEQATLVFPAPGRGGFRRFSALRPKQREAVLEAWRTSALFPRRLVFTSLRAILCMGYFASPVVLRELRLAPYAIDTPVCPADLLYPPIGRPRAEVRYAESDLTPPSEGEPLDLDGPLHPGYVGSAR